MIHVKAYELRKDTMSLTDLQVDLYRRNGFVNGGLVLDDETVEVLRAETLRVIAERDNPQVKQPVLLRNLTQDDARPIWQIVNIYEASPAFQKLITNPVIAGMAAQLSGANELRVWHDQIQYKPQAQGGRLHWHQDSPAWPTLQPKDAQITAWVALDDADLDPCPTARPCPTHTMGSRSTSSRVR
jgi:ectoine hydroxylase-related dioxygenase (phytanoyl-CoA dioxygenase family)